MCKMSLVQFRKYYFPPGCGTHFVQNVISVLCEKNNIWEPGIQNIQQFQ